MYPVISEPCLLTFTCCSTILNASAITWASNATNKCAGDGAEEQQCAAQRQWPFVKVSLQSQAEKTAKVVGQALAAFPPDGCLLTNMHVEHLTQLWTDS